MYLDIFFEKTKERDAPDEVNNHFFHLELNPSSTIVNSTIDIYPEAIVILGNFADESINYDEYKKNKSFALSDTENKLYNLKNCYIINFGI